MADDCVIPEEIGDSDGPLVSEIDITHELEIFRQQWFSEIERQVVDNDRANRNVMKYTEEPTTEDQAHYLFLQGVGAEQSGRLYDAIRYYRKAVQMVPDIESRIDFQFKRQERVRQESECSVGLSDAGDIDDIVTDLALHIQRIHFTESPDALCVPCTDQRAMHIGQLPVEIIQYIFKWVISSDLDVYSLEQLSCVSRGFYLCARDDELWRLVCLRIWGINCGSAAKFGTYRQMYIDRPHLRFNGCYISKCVYYRNGEKSLDNYYRPVHRVEYYRYIRFFPEGKVLMLTSPENPYVVLPNLNTRGSCVQGLLSGYYKLAGDTVTMVLKKVNQMTDYQTLYRYRRLKNSNNVLDAEHTFEAEFTVTGVRDRSFWQLIWTHYAVRRSNRDDSASEFELNNQNYPPLYFSRVRSFNAVSRALLS